MGKRDNRATGHHAGKSDGAIGHCPNHPTRGCRQINASVPWSVGGMRLKNLKNHSRTSDGPRPRPTGALRWGTNGGGESYECRDSRWGQKFEHVRRLPERAHVVRIASTPLRGVAQRPAGLWTLACPRLRGLDRSSPSATFLKAASGSPDDISRDLCRLSRTGHLSVPPRWVQMTEVTRGTATRHVPTTDKRCSIAWPRSAARDGHRALKE